MLKKQKNRITRQIYLEWSRKGMSVKLYEIAKACGVSISTVSRVLNNDRQKPASKATAERVMRTACELGYFAQARGEPPALSGNLTCLLASASDNFSDYFFAQILSGIREEAFRLGYTVSHTLSTTGMSIDQICEQISAAASDGVVLMGRVSRQIMGKLQDVSDCIVYSGLNRINAGIDEVICDAYEAMETSVNHLAGLGFRKIAFVGAIPQAGSDILNEHRFAAFSHAMARHGLPVLPELCRDIVLGPEQAYQAADLMLREGHLPEAVCCANDNTAIGVIGALTDHHYRVPEDVSVIGMDDVDAAKFMQPRLTTFDMHNRELGRFAVKLLDDRIHGLHSVPVCLNLPCSLILRDSCIPGESS